MSNYIQNRNETTERRYNTIQGKNEQVKEKVISKLNKNRLEFLKYDKQKIMTKFGKAGPLKFK